MDREPQILTVTQQPSIFSQQKPCQLARCVRAWAGPITLTKGTIPVSVLEVEFRSDDNKSMTRRFLLDRSHPQKLQAFLERFLGHPIPKLWELEPETLVGRQGPLAPPVSVEADSLLRRSV